jgi:hypothetical protein
VRAVRLVSAIPVVSDDHWYDMMTFASEVLYDLDGLPLTLSGADQ